MENGKNGKPPEEELSLAPKIIPPGVVPARDYVERPFVVDRIMPIACKRAQFIIWIESVPYCGFDNRQDAYDAMHMWRARWPAVNGKSMHLVER